MAMEEYANQCQEDMADKWFEYPKNKNMLINAKNMQKDVEYWQGEYDHWHKQAMEMADELKKLKNATKQTRLIWKKQQLNLL
jgi:hypothetical protein